MFILFWQEFVNNKNWLYLDIVGVMFNSGDVVYLGKGMLGMEYNCLGLGCFFVFISEQILFFFNNNNFWEVILKSFGRSNFFGMDK